jgi:hypothetical protein
MYMRGYPLDNSHLIMHRLFLYIVSEIPILFCNEDITMHYYRPESAELSQGAARRASRKCFPSFRTTPVQAPPKDYLETAAAHGFSPLLTGWREIAWLFRKPNAEVFARKHKEELVRLKVVFQNKIVPAAIPMDMPNRNHLSRPMWCAFQCDLINWTKYKCQKGEVI